MNSLFEVLYPFLVIAEFVPTFFVRTSIWSIWLAANIHKKASEHSRCHRSHHATAAAAEPLVHLAAPEVHHTATQTATPVRVWVGALHGSSVLPRPFTLPSAEGMCTRVRGAWAGAYMRDPGAAG